MRRSTVKRICVALAACAGAMAGCLAFAERSATDRFVLMPGAQIRAAMASRAPLKDLGDHPLKFRSEDYDPAEARRLAASVMPPSIAIDGGKSGGYVYVAGGGWPGALFQRTAGGKWREMAGVPAALRSPATLVGAFSSIDRGHDRSLLIAGADGLALYRVDSRQGYTDVTRKAGLNSAPGVIYTGVAFGDLDGDGFPDLVVASYADLNRVPSKPAFTFPNDFAGTVSRLYRNNGDGTFTDVTASTALASNLGRARKVILADLNGDGRPDILLLRDDKPPALYLNRGGWKFDDATWKAGDDISAYAYFDGAVSDLNGDGKPDLALWATHLFRLLMNQGNASFELPEKAQFPDPAISLFGYRGSVLDLDGNGFDDVITVDRDRRLHVLANNSGAFREMPVELPADLRGSYFAPTPSHKLAALLAFRPDGSIVQLTPRKSLE